MVDNKIQAYARWGTVKQAAERYPAFNESSFRYHIFNSQRNGFAACIRKVGRRVLIDYDAFERWVDGGAA